MPAMSDLVALREAIDQWDRRYNGYVKRTPPIVDAWAVMVLAREAADALEAADKNWNYAVEQADKLGKRLEAAEARAEEAERQLRETETLLQDRIRTLTAQNPDSADRTCPYCHRYPCVGHGNEVTLRPADPDKAQRKPTVMYGAGPCDCDFDGGHSDQCSYIKWLDAHAYTRPETYPTNRTEEDGEHPGHRKDGCWCDVGGPAR